MKKQISNYLLEVALMLECNKQLLQIRVAKGGRQYGIR